MMAQLMNGVKTINSAVRTVLLIGITSVVGYGGWLGYDTYVQPGFEARQAIADLEAMKADYAEQSQKMAEVTRLNERLETSNKLLKVDRRVANVRVMEKGKDENGEPYMLVRFSELDESGNIIGSARDFTLQGDKFYVDGWIATFDDKYVESADELRSASMFVFKSIYGDAERPKDGQRLDTQSENQVPPIYQTQARNEFEQKIWSDFWSVCNDREKQKEMGIRANHGFAGYLEPVEGQTYQVSIRASGGMSLRLLD